DTSLGQFGYAGTSRHEQDIHREVYGGYERAYLGEVSHSGGVQHVGAGLLERLQAPDGVGKVGVATEVILCPGCEDQAGTGRVARGLGGCGDPISGLAYRVERGVSARGEVFDRAARQPGIDGRADGRRDVRGTVSETVLEVC